jgi:glucose/arabinose dehydrogenase
MPDRSARRIRLSLASLPAFVLALLCSATVAEAAPNLPPYFADEPVASGIDRPTGLAFTPDGRLLIAGEAGTVHVYQNGALVTPPALDISARVCSDFERGAMAVAVDPAFATNHFIYLYYTFKKHGVCDYAPSTQIPVTRVSRFVLNNDNTVNPAAETVLIDNIPDPAGYHIGADLHFGKDGFLYVSTGDGGCDYADPQWCDRYNDASRDQHVLLGKVLRITRDGAIPATNPYQGADSARCNLSGITDPGKKCQETFARGLRNPFRMAFDPNAAGTRFFINDVGELNWEEIDLGTAGADYGWNVREGHCALGSSTDCGPPPAGMTNPIYDYPHDFNPGGCGAITGGAFVPNGAWAPELDGVYLYGDLVCGKIFGLRQAGGGAYTSTEFATAFGDYSLVSMVFGPDGSSKALYYVTYNGPGHQVRRIVYRGPRYEHPSAASPVQVSLVPVFRQCGTGANPANGEHAAPLAVDSCNPPAPTVGVVAHAGSSMTGSASLSVVAGDPSTPADEADVPFSVNATDIRAGGPTGGDYNPSPSGPDLTLTPRFRLTDTANGPSALDSGSTVDQGFAVPVTCASTPDPAVGATCTATTSADAITPGSIKERKAMVLQLFRVRLDDSGPNGVRGDADDRLFAQQGIYVP